MFGIITDDFLVKAHEALNELGFRVKNSYEMNYSKFIKAAVNTLNHTKELEDAINCVRMIQFCNKEFDKITKAIDKKHDKWLSMPYEGNELISLDNDDDAAGNWYITNGIDKNKFKDLYLSSVMTGDELYDFMRKGDKYAIEEDYEYYIKPSFMSSVKMKLYNKHDKKIANIVLSDELNVFLEDNSTGIEILVNDYGMVLYPKDYIDSLHGNYDDMDTKKLFAMIEWDVLEEKNEAGLVKVTNFNEKTDIDLVLTIAASTFIMFKRYMDSERSASIALSTWSLRR